MASLLYALRPFVSPLWAALYADPGGAPPNCIWTSMIKPALYWFFVFFGSSPRVLTRRFTLESHLNRGVLIMFTTDASPWGIGGFFSQGSYIIAYFYDVISKHDQEILGCTAGDSKGQQVFECLATLVALRLWKAFWHSRRVRLMVRADNVTTLTLVRKLRVKGPALTKIAQEMALDVAWSTYEPDILEHTPGCQNVLADLLSRIHEPGTKLTLPSHLKKADRYYPPARSRQWWRTLSAQP